MSVRIYDIIATNPGQETLSNSVINKNAHQLYNPSNLGGGYSVDDAGNMVQNNESITFDFIFRTDAQSTGYEKYLEVVSDISQNKMVWLRYAIPINNGYTFAYRPGFVSSVTKTEAKYTDASLLEKVTIQTLGGWFRLYKFTAEQAALNLNPTNASVTPTRQVFSNYPDDFKVIPYSWPYWYKSILEDLKRANGSLLKNGTWYSRWGNVLDPASPVFTMFAIHAPNVSVSKDEEIILKSFEGSTVGVQSHRIKGNGYASRESELENPEGVAEIRDSYSHFQSTLEGYNNKKHTNFKASLANYAVDNHVNFVGDYSSYLLLGTTITGGSIKISASPSGVIDSKLTFLSSGPFVIDTAPWANIYQVNNSSIGVDFSRFVKTTASVNDKITTDGVTLNTIVMRRGVLGV